MYSMRLEWFAQTLNWGECIWKDMWVNKNTKSPYLKGESIILEFIAMPLKLVGFYNSAS